MDVFNRKMFQAGGSVQFDGSRFVSVAQPGGKTIESIVPPAGLFGMESLPSERLELREDGNIYRVNIISRAGEVRKNELGMLDTGVKNILTSKDPRLNLEATVRGRQARDVASAVAKPLEYLTYAAGVSGAAKAGLPAVARTLGPALKTTGKAVGKGLGAVGEFALPFRFLPQSQKAIGGGGLKSLSPFSPQSYREGIAKMKPVTSAVYAGATLGAAPNLFSRDTENVPLQADMFNAQYIQSLLDVINDPDAEEQRKVAARADLKMITEEQTTDEIKEVMEEETETSLPEDENGIDLETKDDVEIELGSGLGSSLGDADDDKNVDKLLKRNAKLLDLSSPRFLSAIRNIGAALVTTGRMGEGLAKGAAAFAQEQQAKDLMREQAELEKQARIEELLLETSLKGGQPLKPSDLKTLRDFGNEVSQNAADFKGGQTAIGFMDTIIEEIEKAPPGAIGGFRGFMDSLGAKLQAFLGSDVPLAQLGPQAKIEALAKVVQQGNLQEILGESGRTISDKDRAIVVDVFGTPGLFDNRDIALEKLRASRAKLANANVRRKADMQTSYDLVIDPSFGYQGANLGLKLSPVLQSVLGVDPLQAVSAEEYGKIVTIRLRE